MVKRSTAAGLRRRLIAAGIVATVLPFAACAANPEKPSAAGDSAELAVVFQPAAESLAMVNQLYAFASDSFAEAGIDVTYNPLIANAVQASQAVATGAADIGVVASNGTLAAVGNGLDVVSVATITKGSTTQITLRDDVIKRLGVKPDAPIQERVEALKGLSLALPTPGSMTDLMTRKLLSTYGVDPDKEVTIRPITEPSALVTAAREGQVDGFAFSPPTSVQPVDGGYGSVWITLAEVPEFQQLPFCDIITSRKFITENPKAVAAFLNVMTDAASAIESDPDAAGEMVRAKYYDQLDPALWTLAWDSSYPTGLKGFEPSEKGFDLLLQIINDQADEPVEVAFEAVYDTTFLDDLTGDAS
ncbi:ABC transporter substrate-binding protein [Microbacterium sp. MAHUQ-60]|uniref:ABC transporter substrate-binding protein n=1 Tax=unclassified Microbacterium TaxID=2609290 RepID=UPI00360A38FB